MGFPLHTKNRVLKLSTGVLVLLLIFAIPALVNAEGEFDLGNAQNHPDYCPSPSADGVPVPVPDPVPNGDADYYDYYGHQSDDYEYYDCPEPFYYDENQAPEPIPDPVPNDDYYQDYYYDYYYDGYEENRYPELDHYYDPGSENYDTYCYEYYGEVYC